MQLLPAVTALTTTTPLSHSCSSGPVRLCIDTRRRTECSTYVPLVHSVLVFIALPIDSDERRVLAVLRYSFRAYCSCRRIFVSLLSSVKFSSSSTCVFLCASAWQTQFYSTLLDRVCVRLSVCGTVNSKPKRNQKGIAFVSSPDVVRERYRKRRRPNRNLLSCFQVKFYIVNST